MTAPGSPLPKTYDPHAVERRLYERWESAGYFHEEPDPARPPFIICMPPPNVTARAHLGHGSTYAPMDVLTRYHRMLGDNADWLPGTDHAAIATEAVLVRRLKEEGRSRESLGRDAYIDYAWQWSVETGGSINEQFRRLGFGADWARSRFTMDEGLSAAVNAVFVQLYREGLIYRGKRLINWDPVSKSTISDAEIEHEDRDAALYFVAYPFVNRGAGESASSSESIVVATTRPETILGDVAIAVHPNDPRYAPYVGGSVLVPPLGARSIPIIADEAVDPEFGTGAVKVTPAHDPADYEMGVRHSLPMLTILDTDACVSGAETDVGRYAGMDRLVAREAIVKDLRAANLLVEERPYRHAIALSERSGAVVEPMLSLQWFMRMKDLAAPALDAYRDGRLRFIPRRYGRTYEQWLSNIRDWNVSRQVWWGHQLPVWYTPDGHVIVAENQTEAQALARSDYGEVELRRDPDTLDTWFSSALWPFSILGWPERTPELEHWYPSQVLITGWEIIFLWVARMAMLGLKIMGRVPFADVFIAPLVFDAHGRKMSKSLGNAIDPLDMVQKYGADAFRMGMLRQMRLEGQEVHFQESRCEEARNFNNKIWNAARYCLQLPEGLPGAMQLPAPATMGLADKWILTRLHDTVLGVSAALQAYDFGTAAETVWKFIWYELCDWYIEASKIPSASRAAVLSAVMNNAMRLLHPLEPFITEEVWLALPHDGRTIVTASWPDPAEIPVDREAAARFEAVRARVENIRNLRAEMGLAPKTPLTVEVPERLGSEIAALVGMYARATVTATPSAEGADFAGLMAAISAQAPRELLLERYRKERERLQAEIGRARAKLSDARFVERAPQAVVGGEREKLAGFEAELERIVGQLAGMGEGV